MPHPSGGPHLGDAPGFIDSFDTRQPVGDRPAGIGPPPPPRSQLPMFGPQGSTETEERIRRRALFRGSLNDVTSLTRSRSLVNSPANNPSALLRRRDNTFRELASRMLTARGAERFQILNEMLTDEQAFNDPQFFAKMEDVLSPLEQHMVFSAWEGAASDEEMTDQLQVLSELLAEDYEERGDLDPGGLFGKLPTGVQEFIANMIEITAPWRKGIAPLSEQAEKVPLFGPSLKREIDFLPITLPLTVFGPTRLMLAGVGGTVLAGGAARAFTDDEKIITGAEIAGGIAPFAPGAVRGSLQTFRRFRPIETPVDLPVTKGSTVRFTENAIGSGRPKGNFTIVDQNKFGFVLRKPGTRRLTGKVGRALRQDTKGKPITRVPEEELINIMRTVRKPKFLLADDLKRMAKDQRERFNRPDQAALYERAAARISVSPEELSELNTLRKISRTLTNEESFRLALLESKEGQVLGIQGGQALAAARLLKQEESVLAARDVLKDQADAVPGVWEVQVEHGWSVLMGLRDDFGKAGAYENVDKFLRNADDIMIRLPVTGELVPASQVQWVPAKGELTDMMISMPKSLQGSDIPTNVAKVLVAAEKELPAEITPAIRKIAKEYGIQLQPKTTAREALEEIRDMFSSVDVVTGAPLKRSMSGTSTGIDNLQLPRQVSELIIGGGPEARATLAPRVLNSLRATAGDEVADDVARGLEAIHGLDPTRTIVIGRKGGRLVTGHAVGETTEGFAPTRVTEEALNVLRRADAGENLTQAGYGMKNLRRVAGENGVNSAGLTKKQILDELRIRAPGGAASPLTGEGAEVVLPTPSQLVEARGHIASAKTGQPFEATLIRGERFEGGAASWPTEGRYLTTDTELASGFSSRRAGPRTETGIPGEGERVTAYSVAFKNPFVAETRPEAVTALTGHDFSRGGLKNVRAVMAKAARDKGHDAIILRAGRKEVIDLTPLKPSGAAPTTIATVKTEGTISVRPLVMNDEDMRGLGVSEHVGEILGLKGGQRRVIKLPAKGATRITPNDFERNAITQAGTPTGRMPIDKHTMMLFPTRKGSALTSAELKELKDLKTFLRKDLPAVDKKRLTQLSAKQGAFTTTELESRIASTKTELASRIRARSGIERRQVTGKPGTKAHDKQVQNRSDQQNDRVRLGIIEGYGEVVPDKKLSAELMEEMAENKRILTEIEDNLENMFTTIPKGASRGAYEEELKEALIKSRDVDALDAVYRREAKSMKIHMGELEHDIAALTKKEGRKGGLNAKDTQLFADIQKQKEFYQQLGLHKDLTTDRLEAVFQNLGIRHILGSAVGYVPLPHMKRSYLFDQLAKSHLYQSIVEPRNLELASRFWGTLENAKLVTATDFGPIANAMGDITRLAIGKPRMARPKAISEWASRRGLAKNAPLDKFIKQLEATPAKFKSSTTAETFADTTEGQFRNSMARLLKDMRSQYGEGYAEEVRHALYNSHFNIFTMLQDPNWFKPTKAMRFWLGEYTSKMEEWNSVARTQGIEPNVFQKMFRQLFDERALGVLGKGEPGQVAAKRLKTQDLEGTLNEFFTWARESAPRRRLGGILGNRPPEEFLAPAASILFARPYAIGEGIASKSFIGWAKQIGVDVKMSMFGMELAETQKLRATTEVGKVTTDEFKEFGNLLRHLDIPGPGQTPLGGLDEIFAQAARSKLILDLSFFTVQGNLALVAKSTGNPQGMGKAIKELFQVTHSDTAYINWLTANAPRLAMNNNAGVTVGLPAVAGGQFRKDWIFEHLPLLGKPAGAFREWNDRLFERGLLVLKTNMIDDLMEDLKMFSKLPEETQGDWSRRIPFFSDIENILGAAVRKKSPIENHKAIADLVNDMLTGSKAPVTSTRAFYERAVFLTPNFFRAQLQWHVKALKPWTLEGFFASRMLLKNYAFWTLFGKLLSTAGGEGEKFNYTKPWRADFLGVRIPGGGYIPVFPSRAVQTITARILKGAFDKDAKQVAYWSETFLEGRASPVASAAWESIRREDFLGRKYTSNWEYLWTWGKQTLPISMESTIESSREAYRGHPAYSDDPLTAAGQIAQQTAIDISGRSMNPANPVEELDRIVKKAADEGKLEVAGDKVPKWFDLEEAEQLIIIDQFPEAQQWADIQEFNRRSRASTTEQQNTEYFDNIRTARERAYTLPIDEAFEAGNATLPAGKYTFEDVESMWREQLITGDEFRDFMKDTENTARAESRSMVSLLENNGIDFETNKAEEIADKVSGDRGATLFGLAILQYNELQPSDVVKNVTVGGRKIEVVDWEQFELDREAILEPYPEETRERVVEWARRLERTKPIIKERRKAGELVTEWFEIPRYTSLSSSEGEFIDIMRREIGERYNAARDSYPVEFSREDSQGLRTQVMIRMVNGGDYTSEQKRLAMIAMLMENSSSFSKQLENPSRISFVLENPGLLMWYDFMFSVIPRELRNLLPPELQARYDEETLGDVVDDAGLLPPTIN